MRMIDLLDRLGRFRLTKIPFALLYDLIDTYGSANYAQPHTDREIR